MPRSGGDVSVLIADDYAAIRRYVRDLLERGGIRVVGEAENGDDAVRLCDQLRPNIVVLDISMPVLGGFAAARQIRELFPETKIIFLTSHALKDVRSRSLAIGVPRLCAQESCRTRFADGH